MSFATAVIAEGWDLDQLRSRSQLSAAFGEVHDVLMYPHDAGMRALPAGAIVRTPALIPLALVLNSLLWGFAGSTAWHVFRHRRRARPETRGGRRS